MTKHLIGLPFALTAVLSGCLFPSGLCDNETRSVRIDAVLAAPGAPATTGTAGLLLFEARPGPGSASVEQSVLYDAASTLDRTTVSAVHLHAGTPSAPGAILYEFPLVSGGAPSNITVVYAREPYQGAMEFRAFFAAVANSPTYADVHVGGGAVPVLAGAAVVQSPSVANWTRANCS
jgi:hypothetical protein